MALEAGRVSRNRRLLRSDSPGSFDSSRRQPRAGPTTGSVPTRSKNDVVPVSPTLPPKTPRTVAPEASNRIGRFHGAARAARAKKGQTRLRVTSARTYTRTAQDGR